MIRTKRPLVTAALAVALLGGGVATASALPHAGSTALTASVHGPDPTADSITKNGSYTVGTTKVPFGNGFAGGTVYYPTNPQGGERFAGVVTMPGFMEPGSVMNLFGTRLASHGFVVLVAEPLTVADQPTARAGEVRAAKAVLAANSEVSAVLDPTRVAAIGHSMGGGGVLEAAGADNFAAVVALHPWDQNPSSMSSVTEPTLVVGGTIDNIAPMGQHATPMYQALGSQAKGMLVRQFGTHFAGITDDPKIQSRILSFLKFEVDGDSRYGGFFCERGSFETTLTSPICGS